MAASAASQTARPQATFRRTSSRWTSARASSEPPTITAPRSREIVHEMAPDAQLYLVCVGTEVDLAAAEAYAKSQGVSVINQSHGLGRPVS